MLALALLAVLAVDGPEEHPEAFAPPTAPPLSGDPGEEPGSAPDDDALDRDQLRRIGITLASGAAGIAAPLLIGWAVQSKEAPCPAFGGCLIDAPMSFGVWALPVTVGVGVGLAHHLAGGKAGAGFGLAGGVAGYMFSALGLGLVSLAAGRDWPRFMPIAGGALISAFSLMGAVAAMELRHAELVSGAKSWSFGRGLGAGAALWLPFTLAEVGIAFATGAVRDTAAGFIIAFAGTALNLGLSTLAGWGVHRALGGRGAYWTTLVGVLASGSIGMAFAALHAHAPPAGGAFGSGFTTNAALFPVMTFAAIIAALGPSVALEWSSGLNSRSSNDSLENLLPDEPEERKGSLNVSLGGGFGPGGATVGLTGTF